MEIIGTLFTYAALYLLGSSGYKASLTYGGQIWGINIVPTAQQKAFKSKHLIIAIISAIVSLYCMPNAFKIMILAMFGLPGMLKLLAWLVLPIGFALFALGAFHSYNTMKTAVAAGAANTLKLGNVPAIQAAENELARANAFSISREGIAFFDARNYCYETVLFNDYRLPNLSTSKEVGLVGLYFVQKYSKKFYYDVDAERSYYPGETALFVGPGGVFVGRTKGRLVSKFKGYIFARRKPLVPAGY